MIREEIRIQVEVWESWQRRLFPSSCTIRSVSRRLWIRIEFRIRIWIETEIGIRIGINSTPRPIVELPVLIDSMQVLKFEVRP